MVITWSTSLMPTTCFSLLITIELVFCAHMSSAAWQIVVSGAQLKILGWAISAAKIDLFENKQDING